MELKLLSGIFNVSPNQCLTLSAGGMIKLTPKKVYKAFRTNYEISNQPGKETIMIVKDDYRWFPIIETYARNQFNFLEDQPVENQEAWLVNFNRVNEHIRKKEGQIKVIKS